MEEHIPERKNQKLSEENKFSRKTNFESSFLFF
jgi:hypothetical protein